MNSNLRINWGGKQFSLSIKDFESTTIYELKNMCQSETGVPLASMKLIAHGALMKDENKTLSAYGLSQGSRIIMMGSIPKSAVDNELNNDNSYENIAASDQENAIHHKLEDISRKLGIVQSDVERYDLDVQAYASRKDDQGSKKLYQTGVYLAEQLMQILFALDGVGSISGFETFRQQRKKQVNTVHGLLERVDSLKAKVSLPQ